MLFRVLGPLEVQGRGGDIHRLGRGKAATVLVTLLQHPNAWVTAATLTAATWHEAAAPPSARANLKTYVWQLRRLLPADAGRSRIESAPGRYRLRVLPGELDTGRVAEHAARAHAAVDEGDLATAIDELGAALALWRGHPYDGVPSAAEEAGRLVELHGRLREELGAAQLAFGRADEAARTLTALTGDDPLREGAWAFLVRALHAEGRRADALGAYRRARHVLARELGVGPGRELQAAYEEALGEAARAIAVGRPRRAPPRAAARFAGGVVLVDGMPGVGKTALVVHAAHGLADAFPDGQFFVDLRGLGPAEVLARLLRRVGVAESFVPDALDERSALWLSELAHRRVLVVLDDADGLGQVAPLLPPGSGTLTLITTRRRDWHVDGAARIALGPLPRADAMAMFAPAGGEPTGGSADSLVECFGGIPAVIREVADRLATRPLWSVRSLAEQLGGDPCRVLACASGHRRALAAPVQRLRGELRSVLSGLAALPAEFDLAAAARILGRAPEATLPALEALVDVSLLDPRGTGRYRRHRLVIHVAACRTCASVGSPGPAVRVACGNRC
ncbi:DNA-binding SARP family transcriptional activator [Prauserella shujinwangii]|uniref:DNA-binding SARP family transcriptional activator n=1 Tax=Prauserella shujinwangii TaxID=1453103 RepID=A0A2T0LTD7_9PSEU|nr:BTAD domain-containing putative transcriptional regulator [Prauserella shujinwangii]PRX47008.1 DNA-binding SARP family transcriptional activator [Prauserella shujinwangii]